MPADNNASPALARFSQRDFFSLIRSSTLPGRNLAFEDYAQVPGVVRPLTRNVAAIVSPVASTTYLLPK